MNCAYGETKVTMNTQYNICACTYRQVTYVPIGSCSSKKYEI